MDCPSLINHTRIQKYSTAIRRRAYIFMKGSSVLTKNSIAVVLPYFQIRAYNHVHFPAERKTIKDQQKYKICSSMQLNKHCDGGLLMLYKDNKISQYTAILMSRSRLCKYQSMSSHRLLPNLSLYKTCMKSFVSRDRM